MMDLSLQPRGRDVSLHQSGEGEEVEEEAGAEQLQPEGRMQQKSQPAALMGPTTAHTRKAVASVMFVAIW